MLSWSGLANIGQENYQCNVGPQFTKKFARENNLVKQFGYELFSQNQKDFNHKLVVLTKFIKKQEHPLENMSTEIVGARGQLRLPKFEIKKFDGKNPIEWTSYYDSFNEA